MAYAGNQPPPPASCVTVLLRPLCITEDVRKSERRMSRWLQRERREEVLLTDALHLIFREILCVSVTSRPFQLLHDDAIWRQKSVSLGSYDVIWGISLICS